MRFGGIDGDGEILEVVEIDGLILPVALSSLFGGRQWKLIKDCDD